MNNDIREILEQLNGHLKENYDSFKKGAVDITKYDLYCDDLKTLLDYITNLEQENERYKKIFEGKERFSKIMPEDTEFIILSKADYDRQQEDIELVAIELRNRIDKAIKILKNNDHEFEGTVYSALNILQGENNE